MGKFIISIIGLGIVVVGTVLFALGLEEKKIYKIILGTFILSFVLFFLIRAEFILEKFTKEKENTEIKP